MKKFSIAVAGVIWGSTLAAGAVAQPILNRLEEFLRDQVEAASRSPQPAEPASVFDLNKTLAHVGGNHRSLDKIIQVFLDNCPRLMESIRQAIDGNNAEKLWQAVHTLKGSVAIFASESVLETVVNLEMMAIRKDLSGAKETFAIMHDQINRLEKAIVGVRKEQL